MTAAAAFLSGKGVPDAAVHELLAHIAAVEAELTKQVSSQVPLVSQIGGHVLASGGKRLRPAFVTLAAEATGEIFDRVRAQRLAACMEMIHMATLIHDDVIDQAATRRGRLTASAVYGNTASILSGDVLLAKAMAILADDGDLEIIRRVSSAVVELAEGEVRELQVRGRFDLDEAEHLEILRMKTASFIQCCCEVGARVAGASDENRAALASYGHHVGLAFQIMDDLLDYRGNPSDTGKPLATDYREGCATLPLIYLSEHLDDSERDFACQKFGNGVTDADLGTIIGWMSARGSFDKAQNMAEKHVTEAISEVRALPASSSRDLLESAALFVISRKL
jgi:octaprenyl-diphosphate synthase